MSKNEKKISNFKEYIKLIKLMHSKDMTYMPLLMAENILSSAVPFINMIYGAKIIDMLLNTVLKGEGTAGANPIIMTALIMSILNMVIGLMGWCINKVLIIKKRRIDEGINNSIGLKAMTMDYQVYEKNETLDMLQDIGEGINSHGGINSICSLTGDMFKNVITIIYSVAIFLGFFIPTSGKWIFTGINSLNDFANSPYISLLLVILVFISVLFALKVNEKQNEFEYSFYKDNVKGNREFSCYCGFIYNIDRGKDIRIYNMDKMILKRQEVTEEELCKAFDENVKAVIVFDVIKRAFQQIINLSGYLLVGMKAVLGLISIGEMTLYIGGINSFASGFTGLIGAWQGIGVRLNYCKEYTKFMELRNEKYDGTLPIEKRLDNQYELEFRNVSFHYPNSDENILKNINAKITVGRKLAIVGKNGAGKSTFIKLLCRLYDPTEGEILLNGIDIRKYDYEQYVSIFAVVFQDFTMFSLPIADNVAVDTQYNRKKLMYCLEQVGIKDRVMELPEKEKTYINKRVEDGVILSGGELQKLAVARALYKDAPVVIMDEPTSALDPASELEIYESFDRMVKEKTAIYISHRMSSCKFCNNIIVFDGGNIIQNGSHRELLADDTGMYAKLWEAQAKYYR